MRRPTGVWQIAGLRVRNIDVVVLVDVDTARPAELIPAIEIVARPAWPWRCTRRRPSVLHSTLIRLETGRRTPRLRRPRDMAARAPLRRRAPQHPLMPASLARHPPPGLARQRRSAQPTLGRTAVQLLITARPAASVAASRIPNSLHDRDAVWPRWRARGDRGASSAQAATARLAPSSPAGATPDSE